PDTGLMVWYIGFGFPGTISKLVKIILGAGIGIKAGTVEAASAVKEGKGAFRFLMCTGGEKNTH
ncbi:MAG: hypothetical protein V3R20_02820, partial [Sphingomonadales bacterium]